MSTITKEWLQQKIADMEAIRDDIPFGLGEDGANTLAALRIALASLEAEPVAWLLSGGGAKNNVSFDSGNAYADPLREVTPLYTAPPAPVSVPDAMDMDDDFDSAFEHGKAVGWNAYRAAMLQGAENSESPTTIQTAQAMDSSPKIAESPSGNSPVIPDGLCPCCGRKQLKSRTCSVEGCEGKHVAHGFCKKHYDIERKKDPSRRESIRAADERYRARKSAASQQEVK